MALMEMVAPPLLRSLYSAQRPCREEPLPGQLRRRFSVLLLQEMVQEHACISGCQVPLMELLHLFELLKEIGHDLLWQRNRSVLLALPVLDGQNPCVKVEIMNPQLQTFK